MVSSVAEELSERSVSRQRGCFDERRRVRQQEVVDRHLTSSGSSAAVQVLAVGQEVFQPRHGSGRYCCELISRGS